MKDSEGARLKEWNGEAMSKEEKEQMVYDVYETLINSRGRYIAYEIAGDTLVLGVKTKEGIDTFVAKIVSSNLNGGKEDEEGPSY
jgi:hypothetical protein